MSIQPTLKIFISYKDEDTELAKNIETILEGILPESQRDLLNIFMARGAPRGEFYHRQIQDALRDHDCFILLYTDSTVPTMDWSWCLYESGWYLSKHEDKPKLIVLHHPGVLPPPPLNLLQTLPVTIADLRRHFATLFHPLMSDINTPCAPQEASATSFDKAIQDIVGLFKSKPERSNYTPHILLRLTRGDIEALRQHNLKELSDTVKVIIEDAELLRELFGLGSPRPESWGELIRQLKNLGETDQILKISFMGWHQTLGRTIMDAVDGIDFLPELPAFLTPRESSYHSTLQILDRLIDSSYMVRVIFSKVWPDSDPRPEGVLDTLSSMMKVGRYFRWGICEHYLQELKDGNRSKEYKVTKTVPALLSALARSLNISAQANLLSAQNAMNAMQDKKDKDIIEDIYEAWEKLQVSFTNALSNRDIEEIIRRLEELKELNRQFLVLAAKRYYEEMQALH